MNVGYHRIVKKLVLAQLRKQGAGPLLVCLSVSNTRTWILMKCCVPTILAGYLNKIRISMKFYGVCTIVK